MHDRWENLGWWSRDLDLVRESFEFESIAVLGHSWGGLMAMEYAIRHPERVSHLILMNTAPASRADALVLRGELARRKSPALRQLDIPTLIIWGDDDFIPRDVIDRIADAIPESRLIALPDCGHFAYLEQPDEARRVISAFMTAAAR